MAKTGLFYSFNSNKTKLAADKIAAGFGKGNIDMVNAETLTEEEFLAYSNLVLGVPTWFDGELPNYWDEFTPALEGLDLKGKIFAFFGLGDQKGYPENFGDAIGIMAELVEARGGKVIGLTSTEGYTFESSRAVRDGQFLGLLLDQENQARLTKKRIEGWVADIGKVMK